MTQPEKNNEKQNSQDVFIFGKTNYKFLFIGLGLILLGFILMLGGGSESPDEFNEGIFNFQRLTLAPILILAGFGIEIYAIMKKNK
ncbi:MAG: DUF3098 domain-containing protein [Bacteroidales bacterium]|nr:DUF3098 domain-containing protein [Bacteroidales bacterium]